VQRVALYETDMTECIQRVGSLVEIGTVTIHQCRVVTEDHIAFQYLGVRYALFIETQRLRPLQIDHGLTNGQRTKDKGQNAIDESDVDVDDRIPKGKFTKWYGVVQSCIFKGVHYEMRVLTPDGYEFLIQDYHEYLPETEVGMLVRPEDIQIMKKEHYIWNYFEGEVLKNGKVWFLDAEWEVEEKQLEGFEPGEKVQVRVKFRDIDLQDYEEEGTLSGEVHFILYKGNHYHLTIRTDEGNDLYVNTNDVWDDGDRVGIVIPKNKIKIDKWPNE